MIFERKTDRKMLAVTAVALLMVCSLGALASESDATYDGPQDVYIFTGVQFSYTPTVSLTEGTVISIGSGSTGIGAGMLQWVPDGNFGTLSGSFQSKPSGGTAIVHLDADWTQPSGGDTPLSQHADQDITFHVYTSPEFTGTSSNTHISHSEIATIGTILTITWLDDSEIDSTPTFTVSDGQSDVTSLFDFQISGNTAQVSFDSAAVSEGSIGIGTYTISGNLTSTIPGFSSATDDGTWTITVTDDLALIYDDTTLDAIVGETDGSGSVHVEAGTNYDQIEGHGDGDLTFTVQPSTGSSYIQVDPSTGDVTVDVSNASNAEFTFNDDGYAQYEFTVIANGTVNGEPVQSAAVPFTVRIYADLSFTTAPTIENVFAKSSSGNPLDMVVSATFVGATSVTYNWGDGKRTTIEMDPDDDHPVSATHLYDTGGIYSITVTASNANGDRTAQVLYDATTGQQIVTDEDGDDGFLDQHGWLWMVFVILTILMIIGYVFAVQHPLFVIGAIVCAILAILLFVYIDFGGIADAIGGN